MLLNLFDIRRDETKSAKAYEMSFIQSFTLSFSYYFIMLLFKKNFVLRSNTPKKFYAKGRRSLYLTCAALISIP